ncbi:the catalytic domain and Interdomain connector of Muty [Jimgerdemannia flammicorona]|uniref:Adenine DNA glycosylase n=1 Tax=Jimgerdemannia flammicorona TaxID=994334 RepID=A0A433D2R4_9FUNG|nr:the catalytic domain and Interdomain connector of Muty [Jimgerdemannia flammicorona]
MPPRPTKRPRVTTASPTADVCDPPDIEDFQAITAACVQNSHAHSPTYHRFAVAERDLIRERLLEWYDVEKREMPWRKDIESEVSHFGGRSPVARVKCLFGSVRLCASRSASFLDVFSLVNVNAPTACLPSHVLVGLQTQVITVIDYYNRWMKAFPTIFDLAKADLEVGIYLGGTRTVADGVLTCLMCWIQTVNKLWTGLGYYSRAKRLWEGAQKVVQKFNGVLPEDAAALKKEVPGVGRYTAGAVSSIAYNQPAELVDGNVVRVLSRLRAVGGDVKASATIDLFWELAKCLVPPTRPGDHNQALMELGATVCTPQNPRCGACPVRERCRAYEEVRAYAKQKKGALTGRHAKAGDAKRAGKADDMEGGCVFEQQAQTVWSI